MKDYVKKVLSLSSDKDYFFFNFVALFSGFAFGVYTFLFLVYFFPIKFNQPVNDLGIIGLTNLYGYSKQMEIFYYFSSLVVITAAGVMAWFAWIIYSAILAKYFAVSVEKACRFSSFDFTPSIVSLLLMLVYKPAFNISLIFLLVIIAAIKASNLFILKRK
ncbi:MAG: hypothetical protein HZA77_11550 [Candidatus Schekmanbacteria bacterium]|nr:hypothetical protein [Candidatus Schekmanbacteria bacterium]